MMNKKIKFSLGDDVDGLVIKMPSGETKEVGGIGVLEFIINNFRYGDIGEIYLSGFGCLIQESDIFNIQQTCGCVVFICD